MAIAHLLQDFGDAEKRPIPTILETKLEDEKLASFEQGYSAGWDDSLKMQSDEKTRLTSALTQNLEDLNFTYQEAYTQMITSVTPVFSAMVDTVLPAVMRASVGPQIVEQMTDLVKNVGQNSVALTVPEGYGPAIDDILPSRSQMPITVSEDPILVDGQVFIKVGDHEREMNTNSMLSGIRTAVDSFTFESEKVAAHE